MKQSALKTIALGTLIVGTLDISEVMIVSAFRGGKPLRILQGIASAVVGPDSFDGGASTMLLGLVIHFCIALAVVTIYFLASRKIPALVRHPFIFGPLYGIAVHFVMSQLIVPLTLIGSHPFPPWPIFANLIVAHVFCVGIPTALVSSRATPASK
jgi:hypothetical protein